MRIRAYLVVFFFVLSSVTQPARAFAPPLIFAAYMTATTGAGTYTLAAMAGAIGIAGMYFTVKDAMDNEVRIPLGPNASNTPPAPSAPSTATGVTQTPSARCGEILQSLTSTSTPGGCTVTTTYQSNGQAWYAGGYYNCGYNRITSTSTPGCESTYNRTYNNDGTYSVYSATQAMTCPAGYTSSGGSCALSNPRQATDDKRCDLLVQNGQFATASDLNCSANADSSKVAPMIRNGKVIAYGTNSSGQPLMWEVTPGAQTYTVREYEQIQTATQTQVRQTTATIDAATSAVTSVQTQTSPGSISSPGTSSVPTTTDPVTQPTSPTNTPTATTNPEGIVFPDDYARRGEAASAANTIKTAIETATNDPQVESPDVVAPEVSELKDAFYGADNKALGLLNFAVPAHTSVCPTAQLTFDWLFTWSGTFDGHCSIAETLRPTMAVIFDTVWLILAFFIVLGA